MGNKAKKKGVSLLIGALAPILIIFSVAIVIVGLVQGLFDFSEEDADRSIRYVQNGGSADDVDPDILEQMHLTPDGLEAITKYATETGWRDSYDVKLPYFLYIHKESEKNTRIPYGAQRVESEKEGYDKYLCYEDVKITSPDLSKFALTWTDIYMFATAIYMGEQDAPELTGSDIYEMAGIMHPKAEYDEKVLTAIETIQQKSPIRMSTFNTLLGNGVEYLPAVTVKETVTQEAESEEGQEPEKTEKEIVARIEQHYEIQLLPKEIVTWNMRYDVMFPEGYSSSEPKLEDATVYARKYEDRIAEISQKYGVDSEIFEMIAEFVDPEDQTLFADSISKLQETSMGVESPYHVKVDYTTATLLEEMSWPMPGEHRLASLFEYRGEILLPDGRKTKAGIHSGWDIGGVMGAEIVAVLAGKVVGVSFDNSSGNYLMIDHGNGVATLYMHCSKILVKVGDEVQQNQLIAYCGSTGASTSAHLHFTLRINGTNVDPADYLWPAYEKDTEIVYGPNDSATTKYNAWKKTHPY